MGRKSSNLLVSEISYCSVSGGGHMHGVRALVAFFSFCGCVVVGRNAVLRNLIALWSDPKSIDCVDSQSSVVFQNRLLTRK